MTLLRCIGDAGLDIPSEAVSSKKGFCRSGRGRGKDHMPKRKIVATLSAGLVAALSVVYAGPSDAAYRLCALRDGPRGPCTCKNDGDGPGQFTTVPKSRCRVEIAPKENAAADAARSRRRLLKRRMNPPRSMLLRRTTAPAPSPRPRDRDLALVARYDGRASCRLERKRKARSGSCARQTHLRRQHRAARLLRQNRRWRLVGPRRHVLPSARCRRLRRCRQGGIRAARK